ncbi:hypothetical protein Strain138_002202 [Pseudogemmatithrix spongiicola]|uniref:Uncharacterized protein n=1 Tax=Pseudogemmatithrix spongiicola TaxID=3062599 RepID=A0AA49K228_9BACT|nr:hypothetical protein Strain138_002202 [Gemmatimonadaceae bacterium 'strain 138']WKW15798.1 hypothetical protein Strain318_002201 [Gemmatimonadaceae bacterium 'strain 318']
MPNRDFHVVSSGVAGALFALKRAESQPDAHRLIEALGGIAGGAFGGRAPDLLDPPTSPNHRGSAHSVAAAAAVYSVSGSVLISWQEWLRSKADQLRHERELLPQDSLLRAVYAFAEFLCRLLSGIIAGLLAGYTTHLGFDALTPRSLSLV